MPTYEFRCPTGHDFERFFRKISDAPMELSCPDCGQVALRRVSAGALHFKGSGFYITDYGKDGKKGAGAPDKSAAEGAGGDAGATKSEPGGGTEPKAAAPKESATSEPASEKKKPKSSSE